MMSAVLSFRGKQSWTRKGMGMRVVLPALEMATGQLPSAPRTA